MLKYLKTNKYVSTSMVNTFIALSIIGNVPAFHADEPGTNPRRRIISFFLFNKLAFFLL